LFENGNARRATGIDRAEGRRVRRTIDARPDESATTRRLPAGAEARRGGGVHFRVWAPKRRRVSVVLEGASGGERPLDPEGNGWFSAFVGDASAGMRYRYRLDGGRPLPDPASRFQPDGPHGPSEVVDPSRFRWTDGDWPGVRAHGQVIYEMHIGAFTADGTWAAAARQLPALADLGITTLELLPVAEFPGRFGWGYDGVDLFAPTRLYGSPDDMRAFVDRAHALGLAVLLDVVYNHLGPDGNYLREFADAYFSSRRTEWGDAINFDGDDAAPVRELFAANAAYWVDEFHLDGLRIDATQEMHDASETHILVEVARRARDAGRGRRIWVVAENEPQSARLVRPPSEGGYGLDALWNDDFHHSAMVALTGRREAYYTDYLGTPQELVSAAKRGFLYQGQYYAWQRKTRGSRAADLPPSRFVAYLQNHDQVANSARGERLHQLTSPGRLRAMTALLLLLPSTPMLFMGQEFAASSPFLYFADHEPRLAATVRKGRAEFLAQFASIAREEVRGRLADPGDPGTFARSRIDHAERERHAGTWRLHRDLLRLRREDPVLARPAGIDGAVLADRALVLRFMASDGDDRLVVVNLGQEERLAAASEPLLAPPEDRRWRERWSSDDPAYGGIGARPFEPDAPWVLPSESAFVLVPERR
jgi:maltooligosyltrehalose trehalohydrolase